MFKVQSSRSPPPLQLIVGMTAAVCVKETKKDTHVRLNYQVCLNVFKMKKLKTGSDCMPNELEWVFSLLLMLNTSELNRYRGRSRALYNLNRSIIKLQTYWREMSTHLNFQKVFPDSFILNSCTFPCSYSSTLGLPAHASVALLMPVLSPVERPQLQVGEVIRGAFGFRAVPSKSLCRQSRVWTNSQLHISDKLRGKYWSTLTRGRRWRGDFFFFFFKYNCSGP